MPEPMVRAWDAEGYQRVSDPMVEMALEVLDRLPLRGHETVLDAGCGTGRVTELLARRLPRGRVIAVDADQGMIDEARRHLGSRADVRLADLLELDLGEPVDVVFSTATFHWIADHDGLFDRLHGALVPAGRLVAQCGGEGNIANVLGAAGRAGTEAPFAEHLEGFERPHHFAGPEETAARLEGAGFTDVRCWLERRPVVPDEPHAYLEVIPLGPHVRRLPEGLRGPFVERVCELLGDPVTVDYVRLNIDARKPG